MNEVSIRALREWHYTGLSWDGGRTTTPYAAWVEGAIIFWTRDVKLAWAKLREEVAERGISITSVQGRMVFTE